MSRNNNQLENIAAEQMILGKVLQSEASFWSVADVLQAQHFVRPIHQQVYQAIRDIFTEGKRMSLVLIESRIGPEYDEDRKSTSSLLTALLRDAENNESALDQVEVVVDLWRHRKLIATLEQGLKEAKKPGTVSTDLLADLEIRMKDISVNSQAEPLKSLGDIAKKTMTMSSKAKSSGIIPGFDTGLSSLDEILGRIHGGDLGFIGARPGDGKTVLGAQLAERASQYGPVLYFQLEMKDEDMARRALAAQTNVSVADIEAGAYDFDAMEELRAATERLQTSRVYIDDRAQLAVEQMRDRAIQMKRSKGLLCIVVDHIRLVRTFQKTRDRFDRVEVVTGALKWLAKDTDAAVIALSQVTRASQRREDPPPQLNDFDGGSSIEQDADWALALFRRDRWLKSQKPQNMDTTEGKEWAEEMTKHRGRIEVYCRKRRRGEDGEMRDFWFEGRRGILKEIER